MKKLLPCLFLLWPLLAAGEPLPERQPVVQFAQAGGEISKSQAASIAQKQHGGKVLSVTRKGNVYRVKLLLDTGRVKIVSVSASR